MFIKDCRGYELEKARPNTSEDFFNKSAVSFEESGKRNIFTVLFVRYFEERMSDFTPFKENPIFQVGSRKVEFKDIVALVFLLKNSEFKRRKRVYVNSLEEFSSYFQGMDYELVKVVFQSLEDKKGYELYSPLEVIAQLQ